MSQQHPDQLALGYYRHYKGPLYQVVDCARHSETEEWLVVYKLCYGDYSTWVRPLDMFTEEVSLASGEIVPRFAFVGTRAPADLA